MKMEKQDSIKSTSIKDVTCLENLVVAYNTVFLMSSIFLVYVAATAHELFSDIYRILSPSLLLPVIGIFIVLLAGLGYAGVAKENSTLISIYTQLLIFIFALEIAAGLGVLSYRGEIRNMVSTKMRKAINDYPENPFTANLVDYVQLELRCCGINSFLDWNRVLDKKNHTQCSVANIILPNSCCTKYSNLTTQTMEVNQRGCLSVLNFLLHKSSFLLSLGIISISTIQILGVYFSYTLATSLRRFKLASTMTPNRNSIQNAENQSRPVTRDEKNNYF